MKLLKRMLEIYSPSGKEGKLARFLKDEMLEVGFRTRIDRVGNLIGEIGRGEEKEVLLIGHLDTVDGKIPVRIEDDKIYGRGAVDAKGCLASFIEAASEFENSDQSLIRVIGLVEEEASSRGANFIKDRYNPDYVVIGEPSGWEGITLGYRGSMKVGYSLGKELTHRGHASKIPAEEAVVFYSKLKSKYEWDKDGFRSVSIRLTKINTKKTPFKDHVEMELDVRTPPHTPLVTVKHFITGIKGEATLEFTDETKAIKSSKNNKLVRAFLRSIRESGGVPRFKLKTGTSDMNILGNSWDVPIIAYGPGDSRLDHTPGEYLEIEEYNLAKAVLINALNQLKNG